jgi:molybdenum cofactor cytidylyltransferase
MNHKSHPNNLSAIILAAGQSQRTAPENKLLLPFGSKTIIQTVLDKIRLLKFTEILVVTGYEESEVKETLRNYRVQFVHSYDYEKGMAASIKIAISRANSNVDGYMILLGDMPWIDQTVLKNLIRSFYTQPESAIVVPSFRKRQGNPVIFSKKYKKELLALEGDQGARSIIEEFKNQVIEVQVENERLLLDIDTWKDYEG